MIRLIYISVIGLFLFSSSLWAEEVNQSLRFEDLGPKIKQKNGRFLGQKKMVESAKNRQDHLYRSFLPTVSANGGVTSFQPLAEEITTNGFTTTVRPGGLSTQPYGSVGANVNVFRGERDFLDEKIRQEESQSQSLAAGQSYIEELFSARKTYWDLIYFRELQRFLNESIDINKKNLSSANRRIRGGLATQTDRLEFELAMTQLQQNLKRINLEVIHSEKRINIQIGNDPQISLQTESTIPHIHDDNILQRSYDPAENISVKNLQSQKGLAKTKAKKSHLWWVPSVDLFGSYSLYTEQEREFSKDSDRLEGAMGVRVSMQIFDGLQGYNQGTSETLLSQGHGLSLEQVKREVEGEYEIRIDNLKLLHELIHEGEDSLKKGKIYYQKTLSEYARGVKNSPDVLSASDKLLGLKQRFAQLRRDYQVEKARLLSLIGE